MKNTRVICTAVLAVVFNTGIVCGAKDFYSAWTIPSGDVFYNTYTWHNAIVDMTGGTVQSLDTINFSVVNLNAGGATETVSVWNDSELNMTGDTSWSTDSATVNLYGGDITDWLYAANTSVVNIYGYGFNYDSDAGGWNGEQLTGFWLDEYSNLRETIDEKDWADFKIEVE